MAEQTNSRRESWIARGALAAGALGLGTLGIGFGAFVGGLQPVPQALEQVRILAQLSGLILAAAGVLLLIKRYASVGAAVLAAFVSLWVLVLQPPRVFASPQILGAWLGIAEAAAIAIGAWILTAVLRSSQLGQTDLAFRTMRGLTILFSVTLFIFGACHFAYDEFTAGMVPPWIPARLFWAWATGIAHISAGLAIITGVLPLIASRLLGVMYGSWALLVHVPRVAADPGNLDEWKLLCVSSLLAGSAWSIASYWAGRRRDRLPASSLPSDEQ